MDGDDRTIRVKASLRVSADLSNLAVVRQFVREKSTALQADPGALQSIIQAVDESVTNIVVHGYRGRGGAIEVEIAQTEGSLMIRLRDQAPPFDPTTLPPPDIRSPLEQRPVGGLGVYLTRRLADRVIYRRLPTGENELTLVKHFVRTSDGEGRTKPA